MNNLNLALRVEQYITELSLFSKQDNLLLAVSGGIDSMVLLHILKTLNYNFAIAHCNFQLRGNESENDEKFVLEVAKNENIIVHNIRFDTNDFAKTNKLNIQEAARNLRYEYFYTLCKKHNYHYILTAHHLDDRIETMLINLLRGTGLKGLTSISVKNNRVVRPLLFFTRKEIFQYAQENNIEWREDSSNNEDKYLRNKIRHQIIPLFLKLKEEFYHIQNDNFYRWEQEMQLLEDYIYKELEKLLEKNDETIRIKKTNFIKNERLQKVLAYYLKKFGFIDKQIQELFTNKMQTGKYIHSKEYIILIDRDVWILKQKEYNLKLPEMCKIYVSTAELNIPLKLKFKLIEIEDMSNIPSNSYTACIDYDKLTFPLTLRKWKQGDFFIPIGMKGKKKISDFLKDIKISVDLKKDIFVLTNNNDIVWVVGYRIDERYKITPKTKKVFFIEKS
jgi:tRNA(Ile)-lysidine synthase